MNDKNYLLNFETRSHYAVLAIWKSICRLGWTGIHRDLPTSVVCVLGLKACTIMPLMKLFIKYELAEVPLKALL